MEITISKNYRQYGLTCHSLGTTDSCSSHINSFGTHLGINQYFSRHTCTCWRIYTSWEPFWSRVLILASNTSPGIKALFLGNKLLVPVWQETVLYGKKSFRLSEEKVCSSTIMLEFPVHLNFIDNQDLLTKSIYKHGYFSSIKVKKEGERKHTDPFVNWVEVQRSWIWKGAS